MDGHPGGKGPGLRTLFLFLDFKELGSGQKAEVDAIKKRLFGGNEYPVVPVRLTPAAKLPEWIENRQSVEFDDGGF